MLDWDGDGVYVCAFLYMMWFCLGYIALIKDRRSLYIDYVSTLLACNFVYDAWSVGRSQSSGFVSIRVWELAPASIRAAATGDLCVVAA